MAIVYGRLRSIIGSLADRSPVLEFILSEPAVQNNGTLVVTDPRPVTIDGDNWVIDLEPTEFMRVGSLTTSRRPAYRMRVRWLDPYGQFVSQDFPLWELKVPVDGGEFFSLINKVVGNDIVYADSGAVDESKSTGFQLNTVTGDLYLRKDLTIG